MDLDAYTRARTPTWQRLDVLARRRRLNGAEADELVALYQATATDLSAVRSAAPDPETVSRLSQVLVRARSRLSGTHAPSWSDVASFVVLRLPSALYRIRWWTVGVAAAFLVVGIATGVLVATSPDALALMGSPAEQRQYVEHAFEEYYAPGAGFATMVWTNNAWIAALCVGTGITGIAPVYVLFSNAVGVGSAGGLMASHGRLDVFLQLIAPHGLLELTAIFVAGAAGLRLFWTWVDPGPRTRGRALAQEGRALFTVAIGLVGVLAVSGLVEGFVTGSTLPWPVKVTVGAVVLAAFWTYVLVLGRRAVAAGHTGDLDADRAGYTVATAG
ncbi:stage II sporulation protein M [Cellulomonas dongxiuzhuiae]|uniref:Stage II sporulation protein M n=1 Tax=Cellulomonas dongxiuzhuiae TaxID=2819979 RepID=A0ABX8GGL3_9CELL|nr:stage II sporulation protein M [Cellulomonas dongxiuzhuiae]MBO3093921.1 stage II sporulation protein M [Cellulomonas dongxiuzhuiae]QWC15005.1 stage II sporulation protein M [Cellulomonas dongxiuzhuiae]